MKSQTNEVARKLARTCILAIPKEKHFNILKEFHGFSGILNFSQTIKDLIAIDQMHVFGISKEMQYVLRHMNDLKVLGSVAAITKMYQKEYEQMHQRIVVIVSVAKNEDISIEDITQFVSNKVTQPADFIFKVQSNLGITIQYDNSIIEYTPENIVKMLKVA